MGFLNKLVSKVLGSNAPAQSPSSPSGLDTSSSGLIVTVSCFGETQPAIAISETEVDEVIARYNFVPTNELGPLKTADQWFEEETQSRRLRDGSKKAYRWLLPFLPPEVSKLDQLKPILEGGPSSAAAVCKTLRALIREGRKAKQPCDDLLHALYGSCVLADFAKSLAFEGMPAHALTRYVDVRDLEGIRIDYSTMGYQCVKALSKTDVKWLVEAFGEPAEHQSFEALWPRLRRDAVSRYCWEELHRANKTARSLAIAQQTMEQWLRELVARNLRYYKEWQHKKEWQQTKEWQQIRELRQREWQERNAVREAQLAELKLQIEAAMTATQAPFAVADLETTGLKADSAEIIELASILVEPDGSVTSEFSMLVKARDPIPTEITQLTGITQAELDSNGQPIAEALSAFLRHIGSRPVFFHNAPFDHAFLRVASATTGLTFKNPVHDTLPVARQVWPYLGTYKLGVLAEHVGAAAPSHRGLGDSRAALAVLLAARKKMLR